MPMSIDGTIAMQNLFLTVAPKRLASEIDESELGDFLQFRVVEVDQFTSSGRSRAEGVHCASAPLVAFAEDHAYPDPEWAAYLIKAGATGVLLVQELLV